ncbi:MAG TPA: BlaI/MecI/CopY family transcriptional regulator [Planctomycetota bacterium]
MTPEKPASLTRAEWKVMRIVWQLGACSARQVYTAAGEEHGWAASTNSVKWK